MKDTGKDLKDYLTLILPTAKVISLCHQNRARSACTSVQSDQALSTSSFYLNIPKNIPKNDNGQCQKCKMDYSPFKKFGMVRVNTDKDHYLC